MRCAFFFILLNLMVTFPVMAADVAPAMEKSAPAASAVLENTKVPEAIGTSDGEYTLIIKDHQFAPARLEVPADKAIKLTVKNMDTSAEEFESHDLKREKVIQGNSEAQINIGPLKAGEYKFVGEFHEDSAHGVIVAK